MPFKIIRNDITKVYADAIVNTANPEPTYAAGTDHAIYTAAGAQELLAERRKIGKIAPGEAAVTPAFRLNAKYIIHTVGPIWEGGNHGEFETLASCYRKSLLLARQLGCESIAFPLISTGVYGFPKEEALNIALDQIRVFLDGNDMDVTLVVYDQKSFALSTSLTDSVEQFIDENYVEAQNASDSPYDRRRRAGQYNAPMRQQRDKWFDDYESSESDDRFREDERIRSSFRGGDREKQGKKPSFRDHFLGKTQKAARKEAAYDDLFFDAAPAPSVMSQSVSGRSLQDLMNNIGETFQQCLLRMIDERGLTDAQVYKKANIDRKLFSKIRCNANYTPTKKTALALAIALELNLDETVDLLGRAGLALSPSSKMDLIVEYCIVNRIYDMLKINMILFKYVQQTL